MEYFGSDLLEERKESIQACAAFAQETEGADFWTYKTETKTCYVKNGNADRRDYTPDHVSGSSECGIPFEQNYDFNLVGE